MNSNLNISNLFRPDVQRLIGYIPGEQPQQTGWTKLNTNENPYPPSPLVVEAIQKAATSSLMQYPDPLVKHFRELTSELFHVDPDWILPGNGSDEILTILLRSFVDAGESIAFPYPSYILYGTLAEIQGAVFEHLPLNADWSFTSEAKQIAQRSKMVFVPNPNSPSGNCWSDAELKQLMPTNGIFVLDEAYGDFRDQPHSGELLQSEFGKQIVITRTLSKSYSLAGIRFGFAVAHPEVIAGMRKVKDSYNCNTLSIAAACAAISDQQWTQKDKDAICKTRTRLASSLTEFGFDVLPSQANFLWCTHKTGSHETLYEQLKDRKILVRYMKYPQAGPQSDQLIDGLRITIGTDDQIDTLLTAIREIL
ncbi:MAG: histidinol-phosphate transaminase [Planctomycetaceae bacterium]|nr:histidinol-phosphate transaminase [Planctomycetaceae bacterium]